MQILGYKKSCSHKSKTETENSMFLSTRWIELNLYKWNEYVLRFLFIYYIRLIYQLKIRVS